MVVENGVLEVTHAFASPDSKGDDDGAETSDHQFEMMRLLREVNVDNSCVGWYQSMYLGIYSTSSLLENQLSYQTEMSPNAVVILYDPMQTTNGKLVIKCYRLSEECVEYKKNESNTYIDPNNIFEEVPIRLSNSGLIQAFLTDLVDGVFDRETDTDEAVLSSTTIDTTFDRLDLSQSRYLEKHLEFLCGWVDDMTTEQQKFQFHSRQAARSKTKADWEAADAPRRMESLLIANQIDSYCDQMNAFTAEGIGKLELLNGVHKKKSAN